MKESNFSLLAVFFISLLCTVPYCLFHEGHEYSSKENLLEQLGGLYESKDIFEQYVEKNILKH